MIDGENELSATDQELMRLATEGDEDTSVNDTTEGDEGDKAETDAEGAEDEKDGDDKPKRGRSWQQRVDALTAKNYALEARLKELEAKAGGEAQTEELKEPDPADYEFNEADPAYLKAHSAYLVKSALAAERKQSDDAKKETDAQAQQAARVQERMANVETSGAEKYEDFGAKIAAAVEAGNIPPPIAAAAIVASPVGSDLAYKLATDSEAFDKIDALANNPQAAARAIGELEAEYLDNDDDLDLNDPLDVARGWGRMQARTRGITKAEPRKVTKAPTPPEHRARGTGGQFEVSDDTEDFAAFERKIMGKR